MCTANICRSPYLELRARQLLGDDPSVVFSSAGTHGFVDSPVSDTMAAEFADRGLDPGEFRGRRLTPALVDEADLILTAEASHRSFILDEQPQASRKVMTLGAVGGHPGDHRRLAARSSAGEWRPRPGTTSTTPTGVGPR